MIEFVISKNQYAIRSEKKGIRVLGIAESFDKSSKNSVLAGVVMRRDLVIDGVIAGKTTIGGDDATDVILSMFAQLKRNDINFVILDGLVISLFNIIEGDLINKITKLPTIAISFKPSGGLEKSIIKRFDDKPNLKLLKYYKIKDRQKLKLWTGNFIFLKCWGIKDERALQIINMFTVQGSIPEPIRVAKLTARAISRIL